MDVSDVNNDGINDIVAGSTNAYAHILQDVTCLINFSGDSALYNMTWNISQKKWLYNRTFTTPGSTPYTVACSKGGYQSNTTTVSVNIQGAVTNISYTPAQPYANYTKISVNFTDTSGSCNLSYNVTGSWSTAYNLTYNSSSGFFEVYADNGYLSSHMRSLPVGNYSLNITCVDTTSAVSSNLTNIRINNYSTALNITADTGKNTGEQVTFYANYSRTEDFDVPGWLWGREIGQVVWNTSDLDTPTYNNGYSVAFADLDKDGIRDDIITGGYGDLYGFYSNGTQKWKAADPVNYYNEVEVFDADNDSYYDELAIPDSNGNIRVFNETGGQLFASADLGTLYSIAVGDLDNDGIKNDIAVGEADGVFVYNSTDGTTWTQKWNYTLTYVVYEILFTDADRDGFEDDIVALEGRWDWAVVSVFNETGGLLWNTTDFGQDSVGMAAVDLDHDGYRDEIIASELGDLFGFEFNGSYGVTYTTSEAIWTQTEPVGFLNDIAVADLDLDGYEDDIVVGDGGGYSPATAYIWAFDNDSTQLWNYTFPGQADGYNFIYSISVGDVNNDGEIEIIFGEEDNDMIHVLNRTGSLLWTYTIGLGNIGPAYGSSPATEIGDINNDGIPDIAVASLNGYAHILQDVSCLINIYNNSNSAWNGWQNMTWNVTQDQWVYNRSFTANEAGDVSYNVTCTKGGYQTGLTNTSVHVNTPYPYYTINEPDNQTVTANNYVWLNVTAFDRNENMTVRFYGSNNSDMSNPQLLNTTTNVGNNTAVSFNWSSFEYSHDSSMVLWMHFNNDSTAGENYNGTGAKVYDYSGQGNNGTCTGTCFYNETGGKFQGAFEYDGVDDYVDLGNGKFDYSTITVCAWFYYTGGGDNDQRIVTTGSENTNDWTLTLTASHNGVAFAKQSSSHAVPYVAINTNQWYHACGMTDPHELWLNGVNQTGTRTDSWSFSANAKIGGRDTTRNFNGTIDEVAIWNRSLSATEILNLYQLKAGQYYWYANLSDGYLMNQTPTRNYWVDNTAPAMTLNYPGASEALGSLTVNFNWTATDNLRQGMYCNLSIDAVVNQSNITVANNTAENYSIQLNQPGTHNWSTTCWDNITKDGGGIGNVNTSATNSFTIALTLTFGDPGYTNPIDIDATQNISVNVSSAIGVSRVWIFVDGDSVNHTMANSSVGYYYNFSLSGYSLGNKTFTIWMNDTVNTVNSTNGTFEIDNATVSIAINDSHPHTFDSIRISGRAVLWHNATAKENITGRNAAVYLNGTLNGTNTTNATGEYSRVIPVPDTLGSHSIRVNVTTSSGIHGENTTTFLVWAPTKVNHTSSANYSIGINASYNLTIYYWRNDTGAADTGALNLTIENSTGVILYRNCSSASNCSRLFKVGPTGDMRGGNYTLNLSAIAASAYHDNASTSLTIHLEEPGAVGNLVVENKSITDFVTGQKYNYRWNTTLNSSWSTMIDPMIYYTIKPSTFNISALNNCTNTSHNESCVVTFNITLAGNTPNDDFQLYWKANWTNYNGSLTSITTVSQVSIAGNPQMNITRRGINHTKNVSSTWQYDINLTNTGNVILENAAVSVYNISSSWFDFHSTNFRWDSDNDKWSRVDQGSDFTVDLYVNITVGNFTEATYAGKLNFTCDEGITKEVNVTIVVDPNITVGANISSNVTRNSSTIFGLMINSTGNAKLVNVTVNYINQSLPSGWLSFNSSPGNITEGTYYNLSINVTIPEYQDPGVYKGVIEINTSNQGSFYRNITIQVPRNDSWRFTPTTNQTNAFGYDQAGIVANLTIVNYGNVPLNFTISYGDVSGAYSCLTISCLTEDNNVSGTIMNPTSKYVAKNSSENFAVYANSKSQSYTDVGIKITMQSNGTPTSDIAYMFYNITNQPPVLYSYEILVDSVNRSYAEINKNVTFSLIIQDDEPEANGINESSARFNFTRPDGANSSHTPTRTNWPTYGDYRDGEKFTLQYNDTNVTGNYTMKFYVKDLSGNERRANFTLQVVNSTTISLVASVGQADSITSSSSQNLTVTANISNHDLAKAYNANLTVVSLQTNWSSATTSVGTLNENATNQSNVTITVAAGTSPGNYSVTVLVEWRQASNKKSNATTSIAVEVLSNYGISLQPNNRSITVKHGSSGTTWFLINMTGNTEASIYSVGSISTANNLTVTYSPSGGAISPGSAVNITVNASVDMYANASNRTAVLNVSIGTDSLNFTLNVTTLVNSSWSVNVENLTINGYSGISMVNYGINVTHHGTGNVNFNFTFNLTGNATTYMNLTRNNRTLNASGSFTIGLNHTAPGENAQYYGNLTIRELNYGVNRSINISYVTQSYSLRISNVSSPAMVEPGNLINVTTELYAGSTYITANTSYVVYINYTACTSTTSSVINSTSMLLNCTAPSKAGSRTYPLLSVNASYNVSGTTVKVSGNKVISIYYRDVYPPQIVSSNLTDVTPGVTVNITINASDDTGVDEVYAVVDRPSGSNFNVTMSLTAGKYNGSISNLTTQGYYNVTFHLNDTLGNDNTSSYIFEVHRAKNLSGVLQTTDVPPGAIQATFSLRSLGPDKKVTNISTNSTGHYLGEVKYFTNVSATKLYNVLIDSLTFLSK